MDYSGFGQMPDRLVKLPIFSIDANRINAMKKLDYINILEEWDRTGVIMIEMSEKAHKEAGVGSVKRKKKADKYIQVPDLAYESDELKITKIEQILFPSGADSQNQENDVLIAFNASRNIRILITEDGNFLRNKEQLEALDVKVLSDKKAVELVIEEIKSRDEDAIDTANKTGKELPDWVGTDFPD